MFWLFGFQSLEFIWLLDFGIWNFCATYNFNPKITIVNYLTFR